MMTAKSQLLVTAVFAVLAVCAVIHVVDDGCSFVAAVLVCCVAAAISEVARIAKWQQQ